jgi:cytochrome c oxidase cbb3-type subunit 1
MLVIPLLSVIMNVYQTVGRGCGQTCNPPPGKFIAFGIMAFVAAWIMAITGALPGVSPFTNLTWYTAAQAHLNLYGFFSMILFGAIYYILPRVIGADWPKPSFVRMHYWLAAAGILLLVVPLAVGGILQGVRLNRPPADFINVTLHFLRLATLGELLILVGHLLFLGNVMMLLTRYARTLLTPVYVTARDSLKTAEVKP